MQTDVAAVLYSESMLPSGQSSDTSMYLGEWRNAISKKLNPNYFKELDNTIAPSEKTNYQFVPGYINDINRFIVPVFSNDVFDSIELGNDVFFSFVSESVTITPMAFNQFNDTFTGSSGFKKPQSQLKMVEQEYYAPSYVFSRGKTSIGVGAVLLQQRFLDDSFGLATFASSSTYQPYDDQSFVTTNRGTGYQLNISQMLPAQINVSIDYRSEIFMNEFDTLGRSYSDPGDFDIPSQYTFSVNVPVRERVQFGFTAEKISYNSIDPIVHSGYSEAFLNAFNSPISPVFKLQDLTIYTVSYKQYLNKHLSWNIHVTSRQQPSATSRVFDRILKNDTASISYRVGISQNTAFGQFDLFASFANKPILIGSTDFGRLSSTSLNSHIEGVASWSYRF